MAQTALKLEKTPELISLSEVARRCGLDKATVRSRLEDLGYEPDESSTAKLKLFPFDSEMEFALKSAKDTVSAMRIRGMRADAQLKELKLAEQRSELVPIVEVVDISQRIVKTLYDEITTRMPKRIAPDLVKAKTIAAVRKVLKTDMDRTMKLLRTNFERFIDG